MRVHKKKGQDVKGLRYAWLKRITNSIQPFDRQSYMLN